MYSFSKSSHIKLSSCHPRLQELFTEVIKYYDCTVIQGWRSNEEQNEYFRTGRSKLRGGQSKHNASPSLAVDVVPCPIDWHDYKRFYHFSGIVRGIAFSLEIPIRWGGDWDNDNNFKDQTFHDLPHFELLQK